MTAADTTMEDVHDRRLATNKASSKIKKTSSLSVSSSSCSSSSLPSAPSAASSARPVAKIVSADPGSFRRVVQELTGSSPTSSPSRSASSSSGSSTHPGPRNNSRLHRFAPAPLKPAMDQKRQEMAAYLLLQQQQEQQQQEHKRQQMLQLHHFEQSRKLHHDSQYEEQHKLQYNIQQQQQFSILPACNPNAFNFGVEPASSAPSLMPLSRIYSAVRAFAPGDNRWAHPVDATSPKSVPAASSAILAEPNSSSVSDVSALGAQPRYQPMGASCAAVHASRSQTEAQRLPSPFQSRWCLPALSPSVLLPLPPLSPSLLPILSPSLVSPSAAGPAGVLNHN